MTSGTGPDSESVSYDPRFEELVRSFLERHRRGERPSVSQYLEEHPDMEGKIREFFPGLILLERLGGHPAEQGDGTAGEAPDLTQPRRLGEYTLLGEIGRGGMGVVYEAVQGSLGRHVALKVLPFHSLLDKRLLERFRREAQAAARLQHPHMIPVHEFGEHSGVHYYTMDLVRGRGLNEVLREVKRLRGSALDPVGAQMPPGDELTSSVALGLVSGEFKSSDPACPAGAGEVDADAGQETPSPTARAEMPGQTSGAGPERPLKSGAKDPYWRSVARVGQQVAEALAYAHGEGILHRDIKPWNLLLDARGHVWVTDFGLAKTLGTEDLTQSGEFVGTLAYMAPERFRGLSDQRADIYGLGMTLYELATLQPAFADVDRAGLLRKVMEQDPPRPRQVDRNMARDLEAIILKATCKQPGDRYQSAAELAEDLKRFQQDRPLLAGVPSLGYRMRRLARRHRLGMVAGLSMVLLALACAAWQWIDSQRALGPGHLAAGDFDGDGRVDLVTANTDSENVSVLLNRGSAAPRLHTIRVGEDPQHVCAADFNGDGRVDLAVTNNDSKTLSVLLGSGDGTFRAPRDLTFEDRVFCAAAGDLDGDEDVDLSVVGGDNKVWILKNQGDAAFSTPDGIDVGSYPNSIVTADADGDGDFDLIVLSPAAGSFWLLRNDGNGAFSVGQGFSTGEKAFRLAAADLDGDRDLDLAFANFQKECVSVLEGAGNGTWGAPAAYPAGGFVQDIAARDLDGDQDPDLVAVGGKAHVAIFWNQGNGAFGEPATFESGDRPSGVLAFDWDLDGDDDVMVSNYGAHAVSLHLKGAEGAFWPAVSFPVSRW